MFSGSLFSWLRICGLAVCLGAAVISCGTKETPYETNLLRNPSFEEVSEGIPKHWQIANFRGLEGQPEVVYGVDNGVAVDGQNSWYFAGDPGTRKWYVLAQEVEVRDITHVRLMGWIKTDHVDRKKDQYAQCNYLLTFFDENHGRFQEMRFADKRTRLRFGTNLWFEEDQVFRVPEGTRYIAVSCLLGMDGKVWFDNVSLSVPQPLDWLTQTSQNFVFHWMHERPFPPGAMQNQQRLFDHFADRLGIKSDVVVKYYLYPDTTSIREILSLKGHQYVSWDDVEFHSINPNDNHEVIHFITDPYGRLPRSMAEGTVHWLHDDWAGYPVQKVAALLLARNALPSIENLTNYNQFAMLEPDQTIPAAASFIGYIVERWGTERFVELHRLGSGANSYPAFSQAFQKVYGLPCEKVEEQWRLNLSRVDINDLLEKTGGQ